MQIARKVVLTAVMAGVSDKIPVLKNGTTGRIHAPIDREIGRKIAGTAVMTWVSNEMNARIIDVTAEATFAITIPMPGVTLSNVMQSGMHVTDGGTTGMIG